MCQEMVFKKPYQHPNFYLGRYLKVNQACQRKRALRSLIINLTFTWAGKAISTWQ